MRPISPGPNPGKDPGEDWRFEKGRWLKAIKGEGMRLKVNGMEVKTFKKVLAWLSYGARIQNAVFTGWWMSWGQERVRLTRDLVEKLIERDAVKRLDDGTARYGAIYVGRARA
jgi:hypothetical protein